MLKRSSKAIYNRVMESIAPKVKKAVLNELYGQTYSNAATKEYSYGNIHMGDKLSAWATGKRDHIIKTFNFRHYDCLFSFYTNNKAKIKDMYNFFDDKQAQSMVSEEQRKDLLMTAELYILSGNDNQDYQDKCLDSIDVIDLGGEIGKYAKWKADSAEIYAVQLKFNFSYYGRNWSIDVIFNKDNKCWACLDVNGEIFNFDYKTAPLAHVSLPRNAAKDLADYLTDYFEKPISFRCFS